MLALLPSGFSKTRSTSRHSAWRALRPAVSWRKLSFGTQSARGSRFVETVLTVIRSCAGPSRHSLDYLTAALQAHLAGQPRPTLLTRV
jgi:transposase